MSGFNFAHNSFSDAGVAKEFLSLQLKTVTELDVGLGD
jgi:hypothetical protein